MLKKVIEKEFELNPGRSLLQNKIDCKITHLFIKNRIDMRNHVLSLEEVLMTDPFDLDTKKYIHMLNFDKPVYGIVEAMPKCKFMPDRCVIEPMIRANIVYANELPLEAFIL